MAYDGTLRFDTSMDTSGFQEGADKLTDIIKNLNVFQILKKGLEAIGDSIDEAVSQYDALNRFPKVMQQMGYSADASAAATQKLSKSIEGLPTTLNGILDHTKQLVVATGDLDTGVDAAIALNNAFLASGATADEAARGMEQYHQMLASGKVDMQSWNTINETMAYALQKTAEAFGFTGASAKNDLYAALQQGDISMTAFNSKIIELNQGVGGFAEVAKTSSGGIGTAWTNLKAAVVNGTTNIIESIDSGLSQTRFKSIENVISIVAKGITTALNGVAKVFGILAKNIEPITIAVIAFAAAWKGVQLMSYVSQLGSLTAALGAMTPVLLKNIAAKVTDIGETIILTTAYAAETAARVASTLATKLQTAAENGSVIAKIALAAASKAAAAAQWLWNAAMEANPIGVLIAGVVALIAVIAALVSWLNFASEDEKKLQSETDDLIDSSKELTDSMKESAKSYEDNVSEINTNIGAAEKMADKLFALANQTNRTASEEAKLQVLVGQLNQAMPELNLQYDKQTGQLNMTEEAVRGLIAAQKDQLLAQAKQARASELAQELVKQEEQLTKLNAKYQEWADLAEKEGKSQKWLENKTKDLRAEIKTAEDALSENNATLDKYIDEMADSETQSEKTGSAYSDMSKAVTETGETIEQVAEQWGTSTDQILESMNRENLSLDEWVENQKERTSEFTNSFKEIPAQFEMSADEMLRILQTNKERYAEWERNMEELTRQVGPVAAEEFRKLGPEANSAVTEVLNSGERMEALKEIYGTKIGETVPVVTQEFSKLSPEAQKAVQDILNSGQSLEQLKEIYSAKISEAEPAVTEAFSKLPPEAQKVVQEMLDSGQSLDQLKEIYGTKVGEATGESAQQLADDPALATAANEQVQKMKTAMDESVGTAEFGAIGQKIATEILNGITCADMSGAMNGISSAVTAGSGSVVAAIAVMSTAVHIVFQNMSAQVQSTMLQMMTAIHTTIASRVGTIKASVSNVGNSITTALNNAKSKAVSIAEQMMNGIAARISSRGAALRAAAGFIAQDTISGFEQVIPNAERVTMHMMDGILIAMDKKAPGLYAKAKEIAKNIEKTMKEALEVHSPSRVMLKLFGYVMMGIYEGMDGFSGKLYKKAEDISESIAERFSISPDILNRLRTMTESNQLRGGTLAAENIYNGASNVHYSTNLVQNITTPKPLSASEMTREGQDMLRRSRWQLP